ncbi:MAG: lysophospholipase [Treponema sp.]|jgi:alpha-beta hydrolase superfamily lysophospholipase|nr:lysophospholipase [Treponema sp.]
MVQEDDWFTSDDGTRLFLQRWLPQPENGETKPLAALHIVHGMAEHARRYQRLAEKLSAAGIVVWAADQRGHGKTADLSVNGPGRGGLSGHCADKDGFSRVTRDIVNINEEMRKQYRGLPLFLLGHSWGSFIVQNYIENKGGIDGCILSGTRGPGGFKMRAGLPLMVFFAAIFGRRKGSLLARAVADGPYNKPFRPNRSSFDWISRDEKEVDAYVNDPCSGYLCSTGFYRDLIAGLCRIHKPELMEKISRDLPIYIFSGSADPVGDMGASPTKLVNAYRSLGIKDLEFVLYPDARHETLNETNREEVMDNLLSWIRRHCNAASRDTSPDAAPGTADKGAAETSRAAADSAQKE